MRAVLVAAAALAVLAALAGSAAAYPQFEVSKERHCSGCHLSPAGGGPLSENGLAVAEAISKWGGAPEFMYGKVELPEPLVVGGDFRYAYGYLQAPQRYLIGFPMQADLYGVYTRGNISGHVTAGIRPREAGNEALTTVWSREHYVMYKSEPGASTGVFARLGRFMPVFGLRFAEHTIYTRRYGGTPLYFDTYGASAAYIKDNLEAHVSAFVKDPLIDSVQTGHGGAAYAELELSDHTWIGAGGMVSRTSFDHKYRGTLTARHYLPGPDLLLQGELQLVNPHVTGYGYRQLVGYAMASWFATEGVMIDLGFGHYDENIRIKNLDRDAFDLNIHFFATSHIEAILISRLELLGWGTGGPTGAYALLMAHYRL